MVALEAGYDLAALALCFVALALLLIAKDATEQLVSVLNVGILGTHPFGGIARAMENTVLRVLNSAIKSVEKGTAKFENGLLDSLGILVAIPLLLAFGVKASLEYLWNHALGPFIHRITDAISTTATNALTKVQALEGTVETDLGLAKRYAENEAADALHDAKVYADRWIDNAVAVLNRSIRAGVAEAEGFASEAVAKLRGAEDAAIGGAIDLANAAKAAGVAAAAGALATAERELGIVRDTALTAAAGALTTAEHEIAAVRDTALTAAGGALTTAEDFAAREAARVAAEAAAATASVGAAAAASLDVVKAIAIGAENELKDLEGIYGALGTATLIASIPAIATLVHAIADEAGLGNQSCRGKVKEICRTDPSAWENLLAGLAPLGLLFGLRELYAVAEPLVGELAPIIKQAA